MCGACGRTVVADPILGPVRTMRQHLIVAQTVNDICRTWAGAPRVTATSGGWLVSRRTGATETAATVETLWTSVLRDKPRTWVPEPTDLLATRPQGEGEDVSWRVLRLGQHIASELAAETCR